MNMLDRQTNKGFEGCVRTTYPDIFCKAKEGSIILSWGGEYFRKLQWLWNLPPSTKPIPNCIEIHPSLVNSAHLELLWNASSACLLELKPLYITYSCLEQQQPTIAPLPGLTIVFLVMTKILGYPEFDPWPQVKGLTLRIPRNPR